MFERETNEGDEVRETTGLGASVDLAGERDGVGFPEAVLGPGGVLLAEFLLQLLEHGLGELEFARAARLRLANGKVTARQGVNDLERRDFITVIG